MFTFRPLKYYTQFLTPAQAASQGLYGYLLELAVKDFYGRPLVISPQGKADLYYVQAFGKRRVVEVKQNGGEFRNLCKGSGVMFYAVYIDPEKTLREQFGYTMPMDIFREIGLSLGHVRAHKVSKEHEDIEALQTLYVYSKADFLGRKAFKLADAWETAGAVPFKEFFVK